ncbi:hypothetical protein ACFFLM_24530 [Deinococcus oregonensis]|uniref:Uncharacterized protein n=1 Tax=Deinococcus oregonensis TaxID=1805970 RepID=A0ABV6B9M8_9DEIO
MSQDQGTPGRRVSRARQRFLGLTSDDPRPDDQGRPPEVIELTADVQRRLLASLYAPGAFRSGPLFGTRREGLRHITDATRGVPPGLFPDDSTVFPLEAGYVLGCSDALTARDQALDWLGQWLMAPDRRLGSPAEHAAWLSQAQALALVDEDTFVLILGIEEDSLEYRAYVLLGQRALSVEVRCLPLGER